MQMLKETELLGPLVDKTLLRELVLVDCRGYFSFKPHIFTTNRLTLIPDPVDIQGRRDKLDTDKLYPTSLYVA